MKEFVFYNINDPNQEPLGKIQANSKYEAEEKSSQIKQLPLHEFLMVFEVKEIN